MVGSLITANDRIRSGVVSSNIKIRVDHREDKPQDVKMKYALNGRKLYVEESRWGEVKQLKTGKMIFL